MPFPPRIKYGVNSSGNPEKTEKLDSCFHRNDILLFPLLGDVPCSMEIFIYLNVVGFLNKKSLNLGYIYFMSEVNHE